MNTDPLHNTCDAAEQDEAEVATAAAVRVERMSSDIKWNEMLYPDFHRNFEVRRTRSFESRSPLSPWSMRQQLRDPSPDPHPSGGDGGDTAELVRYAAEQHKLLGVLTCGRAVRARHRPGRSPSQHKVRRAAASTEAGVVRLAPAQPAWGALLLPAAHPAHALPRLDPECAHP